MTPPLVPRFVCPGCGQRIVTTLQVSDLYTCACCGQTWQADRIVDATRYAERQQAGG